VQLSSVFTATAQSLLLCRTFPRTEEVPYKLDVYLTRSRCLLFSFGENSRLAEHLKGSRNNRPRRKMVTEFSTCTNRISTQDIAGHVLHNSMSPYSFKS